MGNIGRKLGVSCKALWDLWEHNHFGNGINLSAFIALAERSNFPEVILITSAHFQRQLMQRKSKTCLVFWWAPVA